MKKPIRILLFSSLYPSSERPIHGIFVETRLRHLLASGHIEVFVVAPVPWFPFDNSFFGEWARLAKTPRYETLNNIPIAHPRYFLPPKVGMSIAPFLMSAFCLPTIRQIQKNFDFDIIDAHYFYPDGVAAALIARSLDKPFVVTARGSDLNLISRYLIPRHLIRWAANRASASIGVCQALTNKLEDLGVDPSKIYVLRNGVDLGFFSPLNKNDARSSLGLSSGRWLISVGWLIESKGHAIAIKALPSLPGVNLAIIGEGVLLSDLQNLASQLGLADRVRFLGSLPQSSLRDWYSAADALVLCSESEGWANVLLESLACGTPVVATNIGGIPEVIQDDVAGCLMTERSPNALAISVLHLFSHYPHRDKVREYAESFGWDETTNRQLFLFNKIISKHLNLP